MELVKLGKRGRCRSRRALLRRAGAGWRQLADRGGRAADGAIVLRPAAIYPIEIYTDERIKEFEREGEIDPEMERRVQAFLDRRR